MWSRGTDFGNRIAHSELVEEQKCRSEFTIWGGSAVSTDKIAVAAVFWAEDWKGDAIFTMC